MTFELYMLCRLWEVPLPSLVVDVAIELSWQLHPRMVCVGSREVTVRPRDFNRGEGVKMDGGGVVG